MIKAIWDSKLSQKANITGIGVVMNEGETVFIEKADLKEASVRKYLKNIEGVFEAHNRDGKMIITKLSAPEKIGTALIMSEVTKEEGLRKFPKHVVNAESLRVKLNRADSKFKFRVLSLDNCVAVVTILDSLEF